MDCAERNDFVNNYFLVTNYLAGDLVLTADQKASLADSICAVDCEGFFAFIKCLRDADHNAASEVICMTSSFPGVFTF